MPLNSEQEVELQNMSGYGVHFLNHLDDYCTKAVFIQGSLKQLYKLDLDETEIAAAAYCYLNREVIAQSAARALAVNTDVLPLGKDYTSAKEFLTDLKTDVLKPYIFALFKQWLSVIHAEDLKQQAAADVEATITP